MGGKQHWCLVETPIQKMKWYLEDMWNRCNSNNSNICAYSRVYKKLPESYLWEKWSLVSTNQVKLWEKNQIKLPPRPLVLAQNFSVTKSTLQELYVFTHLSKLMIDTFTSKNNKPRLFVSNNFLQEFGLHAFIVETWKSRGKSLHIHLAISS